VLGNERQGYVYTRYGNPTTAALETAIASLEGAEAAIAFSSGMGALHNAILSQVQTGSRIVAAREIYGATNAIFTNVFATLGVKTTFVDIGDLAALEQVIAETKPRAVFFETISNPLLKVADIPAIAAMAKRARATVIVDNTFASPLLVNPLALGADVVVHSSTKYLSGHGDVTGGAIATDADRAFEIRELLKLTGAIPGPFEAWLTLRGIKTLPLRMRKQCENAALVADWLAHHPLVAQVHYPGHREMPPIFNDGLRGGMVTFEVAGGCRERVFALFEALRLCQPATTLGDVYSLVLYPPMSTHRGMSPKELAALGICEGLVRMSVGIEDVDDIVADLDQALATACAEAVALPRSAD
jgi:cystathionine gamma-synthase/methionine-gamma-lyase